MRERVRFGRVGGIVAQKGMGNPEPMRAMTRFGRVSGIVSQKVPEILN